MHSYRLTPPGVKKESWYHSVKLSKFACCHDTFTLCLLKLAGTVALWHWHHVLDQPGQSSLSAFNVKYCTLTHCILWIYATESHCHILAAFGPGLVVFEPTVSS